MNAAALEKARSQVFPSPIRLTNFYPRYDGNNDQVDAILRIQPASFQRIIPRYRLSTSETRDVGSGPMFDEVPGRPFVETPVRVNPTSTELRQQRQPTLNKDRRRALPPLEEGKGRYVDILA